jgi:hypothetical protein
MTLSPLATAVSELLADTAVTAITTRIRGVEPAPGDALGAGHYQPFVVVSTLDAPWHAGTATSSVTLGLRCYAASHLAAEALALACAAVFHRKAGRIASSRLGIYSSTAAGGPTPDKDVDTGQPLAHLIVTLNVSTQAIPA